MFNWSQDWQMLFNTDKNKVMHFGFNNKEVDYLLENQRLDTIEEEIDLGVIVDKSQKSIVDSVQKQQRRQMQS